MTHIQALFNYLIIGLIVLAIGLRKYVFNIFDKLIKAENVAKTEAKITIYYAIANFATMLMYTWLIMSKLMIIMSTIASGADYAQIDQIFITVLITLAVGGLHLFFVMLPMKEKINQIMSRHRK